MQSPEPGFSGDMQRKKQNLLTKEKERKIAITLPAIPSILKEVICIFREEKNHIDLWVLWKGFQKSVHLKWTLMDIRFQLATDSKGRHKMALMEGRISSSKA